MNNIWNKLSEEVKNEILKSYESVKYMSDTDSAREYTALEIVFGKENLNSKEK